MKAQHQLRHQYFSTACWHEQHERCRQECEFCKEKCICPCHKDKAPAEVVPIKEAA